ncbi:MAG: RnfH family protein [Methylovulum miyakonense]|uniref:RnfH family protein n=1 Tax=Methylovulum miyakonense TaxID=645578 RepID=UPI003BB734DD
MSELLAIEVAYAAPGRQTLIALELPAPATVADAIRASGIQSRFPELANKPLDVGIFGRATTMAHPLKAGDRIEIYRQLIHNPKEARRIRAAK